jgi:TP901 family phage tail tape measure protein
MASKRKIEVELIGDSRSLERAFKRGAKAGTTFSASITGLRRSIAGGLGLAAGAGAVVLFTRALTGSVKAAGDFQLALQKMVGLSGVAQSSIRDLRSDVLALAPVVGKGPQELAEALFFITSSGIPAAKALDVLTVSAKASAAGLGETQTVADAVTSALNAYGPAAINATQATDVLVATVREGKGEADQFAGVIGNVAALAAELGVSFDQVGAALAAQTRLGTDAETAATQLNQVFSALLNTSPKVAKAYASVGLNLEDLRKSLQNEGLLPTLTKIKNAFGDNTTQLRSAIPEIRAFRGVLALVGKQAGPVKAIFDRLAKSTGSLGAAFNAISGTQAQQFAQLNASLEVFKITVGAALAPAIKDVLDPLTKWLAKTENQKRVQGELTRTVRDAVGGIRAFLGVVRPLAAAAKDATDQLGGLKRVVELLTVAFVASKLLGFASAITGIGTAAGVATGRVAALRLALLRLGALAVVTVGIEILLNKDKIDDAVQKFLRGNNLGFLANETIKIPVDADLGALIKMRNRIADVKGESDLMVKALDKIIARLDTIDHSGFVDQPGLRPRNKTKSTTVVKVDKDKSVKTAAAVGESAGDAAKKAFNKTMGLLELAFDKASQTTSLRDDLGILKQQEKVLRARIAHSKNDLDLQKQLVAVQGQQRDILKEIAANQATAKNARQFKALGLTGTGDTITPSAGALSKRLGSVSKLVEGSVLDTPKTAKKLAQIAKVLSGKFGKVGKDVRAAILQMLNDIQSALDSGDKKGPLTKTSSLNTFKVTAGLGLTPEQERALRSRLSGFNSAGLGLARGQQTGNFVVESHTTINVDGAKVANVVTRQQQKNKRRNPRQKRGPHRIGGV